MASIIKKIDFKNIAPRNGSQADAFEEFCCQIARRSASTPSSSEFIRYRGAGGDGGVECVVRFPSGEEWGWQAKYMFNLQKAKASLDESIATAIRIHPSLTRYTICLPFDLTGPTARRGKSQREYFDEYRKEWEQLAQTAGVNLQILLATPSIILDDLLKFDPEGGRLRYWFDATFLTDQWFERHLADVKASAYPRYTPELRIETPLAEALAALGLTDEWFNSLTPRSKEFKRILKEWEGSVASRSDSGWGAAFPDACRPDGEKTGDLLAGIAEDYQRLAELKDITVGINATVVKAKEALHLFSEVRQALAEDLEAKHGPGTADSKRFREFQAQYQASFPAANVDAADEVIKLLEEFISWAESPVAKLPAATELLVLGRAGVGKTHGICDTAESRTAQRLRTVVIFGERLSGTTEPWEQIRLQLGFDATLSRDAMLAALDAAGETSGKPLLLCIDGLNETRPRTYWRSYLPSVITHLHGYPWIRLCVSCRTTYKSQVIPDTLPLPTVTHQGFEGIEFNACNEFFTHYGLEPPVSPVLQPEFSNPLFLRLICEAMVASGLVRLPAGWYGINTAINAFVQAKNRTYAEQHDLLPHHRIPERGLKAFIAAAEAAKRPALSWSDASNAINSVLPAPQPHDSLIDWLIREGLLIVDASPNSTDPMAEEHVRIAFERLGDHLLTSRLLDNLDNETVQTAFDDGQPLAFTVSTNEAMREYKGLLEALAVQIPERFGVELPNCTIDPSLRREFTRVTTEALLWRDPSLITEETGRILSEALSRISNVVFDTALSISVYPSSVDAFWLHQVLASVSMAQRDAFWCGYLHQSYQEKRQVEKLIRAAFEADPISVPHDLIERWATVLLWFCAAADRRVRDFATRALVRVTEPSPAVWARLVERFASVNDEYIIERCLAAAYGTLLRVRDMIVEGDIAGIVYREVFADPSRFQNASIRDYARSILELAAHDDVLPEGITEGSYMPPYKSEWPLSIPTEEELKQYEEAHEEVKLLYFSCMYDDFNHYTLNALDSYDHAIDKQSMARWVFQHVLDMGYAAQMQRLSNYDGYMVTQFGGMRGRPAWAERIGKKYQWIALARLAARVSDNIPAQPKWDEELLRTPLTYPDGRDIDPSLLLRNSPSGKVASWWLPERYDFEAHSNQTNDEWAAVHNDLPDTEAMLQEKIDSVGCRWIILEGYPSWSSKPPEADWSGEYRHIWLHIRSYLVAASEADACWQWLQKQNFMGDWMPRGTEYHEGFVGEYPWGLSFNLHDESYVLESHYGEENPPYEMYPTVNSLGVSNEYDAFQEGSINIHLPARKFFGTERLVWDKTSGYVLSDGSPCFTDPSVVEPGPSALLINTEFLQRFLKANNLVLMWAILGEKLVIRDNKAPRLTYSRAHMLSHEGFRSAPPVIAH